MIATTFSIASGAFIDLEDAGRVPHILNSIEVYNALKDKPEYVQVAGILHDIVARTEWSYGDLSHAGISDNALELIELVNPTGDINHFLPRAVENRFACHICLANLRYHMNLGNLGYLGTDDLERIQRYSNTYQVFKRALSEFHYD